jgi:hypothetical protein
MNRAEARDRVRLRIDDEDGVLATDAQINDALDLAQEEVWHMVVEAGGNLASREAALTATNGTADLSTLSGGVLRLINISEKNGVNGRLAILPARASDGMTNYPTSSVDLYVTYIPQVTAVTGDVTDYVWGDANTPSKALNELMVLKAAQSVKITENEVNGALERRAADMERIALGQINIPSVYAMPLIGRSSRTKSRLRYIVTSPYTLQLVW